MKELTQKQREVFDFIKLYINSHTYSPTIREVAEEFSVSVKAAYDHVDAIKRKGFLVNKSKLSRTLEVVRAEEPREPPGVIEVPILGAVVAGRPIYSEENYEGVIKVHSSLLKKNRPHYVLRVTGDSMVDAGIMDGDYAIIEKTETAHDNDIIVAMVEEKMTLKRYFRENNRIRLQAENREKKKEYRPIYSTNVQVLGKLAGVYREYR